MTPIEQLRALLGKLPNPTEALELLDKVVAVPVEETTRHCGKCNAPRKGLFCWKCDTETTVPAAAWTWPGLPPVDRIRALAKEVGYALGEHGSRERDLDLIAAPWREDAVSAQALVEHIAAGLPARIVDTEQKPLGRFAANLSMGNWTKMIDLSVSPAAALPVVGEPVAWVELRDITMLKNGVLKGRQTLGMYLSAFMTEQYTNAIYLAPADSIPRARLDELLAAEKRVQELEQAFAVAYGVLWHVNAGMDAPFGAVDLSLTPERGAMEARKAFGKLLTKEQRGDGINAARDHFAALAASKGGA